MCSRFGWPPLGWVHSVPGSAEAKNKGFTLSGAFTPVGCRPLNVSTFLPVRVLLPGVAGKEMTSNARLRVIVNDKVEPDDILDQGSE